MNIDLTRNPKQAEFFAKAIGAAKARNPYRYLGYGGAVRGGKTFISLGSLALLAKDYPGFRSHVIRKDFTSLEDTSIPSMEKILGNNSGWGWNRSKSNYFVYHKKSDGKIFFKGENISRDPELNDFLGLETNAFLLEQCEELSVKMWEKALERVGSWYIPKMPEPIILMTFNPTQTWVKDKIYDPWTKGLLKEPYFFQPALPTDNPFVTPSQWQAWEQMAERYRKQFIEGDWTDFTDENALWAFAFSRQKHVGRPELNIGQTVYLSFDFNKNPICCSVIQHYGGRVRILETIKLANSDIYRLCDYILVHYRRCLFVVTGDATGKNTTALVRDNLNFYKVIRQKLNLAPEQISVPGVNPSLEDNQVLVNSILAHYPVEMHEEKCKALIFDLNHVKSLADGSIEKGDRKDPAKQADALDTLRYWMNRFMGDFLMRVK